MSIAMIRLLRQDQNIPEETDGAVKYEDIVEEFNKKEKEKFEGASQWSLNDWISTIFYKIITVTVLLFEVI